MSQVLGLDGAIGSAAMVDEPGHNERNQLERLEQERRTAVEELNGARARYQEAVAAHAECERKLLNAHAEAAKASLATAATVTRTELEAALANTARDIESATGTVVEVGNRQGWGELERPMERARQRVSGDQLAAVIAVKPIDQLSTQRPGGVLLALELTGRIAEPHSTVTAAEKSRRLQSRPR